MCDYSDKLNKYNAHVFSDVWLSFKKTCSYLKTFDLYTASSEETCKWKKKEKKCIHTSIQNS